MFRKIAIFSLIIPWLLFSGCASRPADERPTIFVSILPLRGIVSEIVGDDFRVEVLVPPGMNPESFEPTPRQMIDLNRSQLIFNIGWIDFEQNMLSKIEDRRKVIDLHRGIEPIAGSCSHADAEKEHRHGVDPHIWNSPRTVKQIAATIYEALARQYPDSARYKDNYHRFISRLDSLDSQLTALFGPHTHHAFIIYHPALTYLARDYGLQQIALENEGKEPSTEHMRRIIDTARNLNLTKLFYQRQFSKSTVDALARELNIPAVPIDPLAPDVINNTLEISKLIAQP